MLGIGVSTYYKKLEKLYQRCLELLDKHETKKLSKMHFNELWLTTDKFSYSLNNIRKKGHGKDYSTQERPLFPTYIIAIVDSYSRYAFRTDLAFDYNITAEDVERDILNVDKTNYVSDEDNSIITALMRIFSDEIKNGIKNVFTCRIDKSLKKKDAYLCYKEATKRLHDWKDSKAKISFYYT